MKSIFQLLKNHKILLQNNNGTRIRRYLQTTGIKNQGSSGFLSPAYQCQDAWERRLEVPIMKNVNPDELFQLIDNRYQKDKIISAIDVDLFVNKAVDQESIDEMEELIYRLRQSVARIDQLPSTGHAILRKMMAYDEGDEIIQILNDRYNYGIFPDSYTSNILMDYFIKNEKYRDAAKIAGFIMLQEDFDSSPITKFLSLYSCLKYLENPEKDKWEPFTYPPEITSKEEKKVRLNYLRNPHFDDHFDLDEPKHIVGKTLTYISLSLNEDSVIKNAVNLLGLILWEKWDKACTELKDLSQKKSPLPSQFISQLKAEVEARITELEAAADKSLPKPKIKPYPGVNIHEKDKIADCYKGLNLPDPAIHLPLIKELLISTEKSCKEEKWTLFQKTEELLKKSVAERESEEIAKQQQVFIEWEKLREEKLSTQIQRVKNAETLEKIQNLKQDLQEREEVIFFFENEEEWMMKVPPEPQELKWTYPNVEKHEKLMQKRRGIVSKTQKISKKARELEDETYVPPTM